MGDGQRLMCRGLWGCKLLALPRHIRVAAPEWAIAAAPFAAATLQAAGTQQQWLDAEVGSGGDPCTGYGRLQGDSRLQVLLRPHGAGALRSHCDVHAGCFWGARERPFDSCPRIRDAACTTCIVFHNWAPPYGRLHHVQRQLQSELVQCPVWLQAPHRDEHLSVSQLDLFVHRRHLQQGAPCVPQPLLLPLARFAQPLCFLGDMCVCDVL